MSERSSRSILVDILIFLVIVGLGLAAVYLTGNWEWFMVMLDSFCRELMDFIDVFTSNIGMATGSISQSAMTATSL